ncbi:hypothetical protein R1sor_026468 [Riccia sorocarpa]|uniref:Neprosin PEP catalytic domain-containing protein n=1 Tax=Riccia sorocarpa TaxID=122646 RepID=A0ABD3GEL0_9MARC
MENYLVVSLILVCVLACLSNLYLQRSYSAESALNFKLSSGEEISCVPIHEQPSLGSLDHATNAYLKLRSEDDVQGATLHQQPSLDSLPEKPAFIPSDKSTEKQTQVIRDETEIRPAEQLFKSEVGSCPEGMIPILRNQRSLRRTRGISRQGVDSIHGNYGHKLTVTSTNNSEADPANANANAHHEYAIDSHVWPTSSVYLGANGYFNVWKPSVELSSEFSLSQLWITAGSYSAKDLNTIEVGWQVCKNLYGDDYPHLFVYWTRDAYNSTGCYNQACPGFVQTSKNWTVGGSLAPVSVTNGTQYEIQVLVFLDNGTSAWWLNINGDNACPT